MSTQTKVKWTYIPGKKLQLAKGERPKGETWNKVVPTTTYVIHNPHRPPVSRDRYSADSKREL